MGAAVRGHLFETRVLYLADVGQALGAGGGGDDAAGHDLVALSVRRRRFGPGEVRPHGDVTGGTWTRRREGSDGGGKGSARAAVEVCAA